MTKEIIPQSLNSVWASETPNKLNINDTDIDQGVIYQSLVVSNQMNGALYRMSQALRAHQLSGGYWTAGQRYYKGQIVSASVIEDINFRPTMRFYECINDDNGQGIVDVPLYRPITAYQDLGGVRTYTVDPKNLNTTNWRMLDGQEDLLKNWVYDRLNEMKDYVDTEIKKLTDKVDKQLADQKTYMETQFKNQQDWVNERVNSITDKWKNLGTINGGTFNFNFAGDNNNFNCFIVNFASQVTLGTCSYTGAKERSGCFLINSGGNQIISTGFFTNVYATFNSNPWFPIPRNSGNGAKIWLFYKVHPTYGVCFTRG